MQVRGRTRARGQQAPASQALLVRRGAPVAGRREAARAQRGRVAQVAAISTQEEQAGAADKPAVVDPLRRVAWAALVERAALAVRLEETDPTHEQAPEERRTRAASEAQPVPAVNRAPRDPQAEERPERAGAAAPKRVPT